MEDQLKFLILNGPNINLLGEREPDIYGTLSLTDLEALWIAWGEERNIDICCAQSNHEGELVDILQEFRHEVDGVVLNAAAYTHTSLALRDCIAAIQPPVVEVHISNTAKREAFRSRNYITATAAGVIAGFGIYGYILALEGLLEMAGNGHIRREKESPAT